VLTTGIVHHFKLLELTWNSKPCLNSFFVQALNNSISGSWASMAKKSSQGYIYYFQQWLRFYKDINLHR